MFFEFYRKTSLIFKLTDAFNFSHERIIEKINTIFTGAVKRFRERKAAEIGLQAGLNEKGFYSIVKFENQFFFILAET